MLLSTNFASFFLSNQLLVFITFENITCISIFRSARLLDARWCVKMTWLLILIKDHATRSLNQSQEYCCVLTMITLLNAIRKFHVDNIIEYRICMFRFDGEYFQTAGSSKFGHRFTFGMGNYKNKALTTGCNGDSSCYVKMIKCLVKLDVDWIS